MTGPISYIGGKNRLAKQIIKIFPEHTTYVEAFAGGAQVFFHEERSKVEVLNDLDGEIVNFYRVCQWHHDELIRYFKFSLVSRKQFDMFKKTNPATLTDVQQAARYLYLQKTCYGGLVRHKNFSGNVVQSPGLNLDRRPKLSRRPTSGSRESSSSPCRMSRCSNTTTARQHCSTSIRPITGSSSTTTISSPRTSKLSPKG